MNCLGTRLAIVAGLALAASLPAAAQPAHLVRDINTVEITASPSDPQRLAVAGGRLFYSAADGNGREPWTSNGQEAGTALLLDVSPGTSSSPVGFVDFGGTVYFTAESRGRGRQIWRTDGTAADTVRVTDIGWTAAPTALFVAGGQMFFLATTPEAGRELWRSDGTAAGTRLVKDIVPGTSGGIVGLPAPFGNIVLFAANTDSSGVELWRSDGTEAGTSMVTDLSPTGSSFPLGLTPFAGRVFFAARSSATGDELWSTDGTAAGTTLVRDTVPGPSSGGPGWMTAAGSTLYFSARGSGDRYRLWKSDGTTAGTAEVPLAAGVDLQSPQSLAAAGGVVYFAGTDATGEELWRSDGSAAGTFRVADVAPGAIASQPRNITPAGGRVYFVAMRPDIGRELWSTDGTPGGTRLVRDLKPGAPSGFEGFPFDQQYLVTLGNQVLFTAADDLGRELWRADPNGASLVRSRGGWARSGVVSDVTALGQRALFVGRDQAGAEPWSSDGTAEGTFRVKDVCPGACPAYGPFLGPVIGDVLYMIATEPAHGSEIWRTDGTEAGTRVLVDFTPGPDSNTPTSLGAAGDDLFFSVVGIHAYDTVSGTLAQVADGYQTPTSRSSTSLAGRLIAGAGPPGFYDSVYRSDGSPEGTVKLDHGDVPRWPTSFHGGATQAFFAAIQDASGHELWRTDGTIDGTRLVRDICPGTCPSLGNWELELSIVSGDRLFFAADDGTHGEELWISDGTEGGTRMIRDLQPGTTGSHPGAFAILDGAVYFAAEDDARGRELWRTDGTEGGTFLVKDILPGRDTGLTAFRMTSAAGRLLFMAYQPLTGIELWESDGTAAGTHLLQEFWPGPNAGGGDPLGIAGNHVFLAAGTEQTGGELWALPIGPRLSVADAHATEGDASGGAIAFEVRLDGDAARPTVVTYATDASTAQAGIDFVPTSGSLTFAPGERARTVSVPIIADGTAETTETFALRLTGANAALQDDRGDGVIEDDDAPHVAAAGGAAPEGDSGPAALTVSAILQTKDGLPSGAPVAIAWDTVPSTAGPTDYVPGSGVVTFPAGSTSGTTLPVTVFALGDTLDEPDEAFRVALRDASNVSDAVAHAQATIADDDGAVSGPLRELTPGGRIDGVSGPEGLDDWFVVRDNFRASYEVILEGVSGDFEQLWLARDFPSPQSQVIGTGSALSLRWFAYLPDDTVKLRLHSEPCASSCGPDDTYRLRAYETTLAAPRIRNDATTRTVVILFNRGDRYVTAVPTCWSVEGLPISTLFSWGLYPKGSTVIDTASLCPTAASLTVAHDGSYGNLTGKAVTFDPVSGLSFDTPLINRTH